jgi:hypothetical protein
MGLGKVAGCASELVAGRGGSPADVNTVAKLGRLVSMGATFVIIPGIELERCDICGMPVGSANWLEVGSWLAACNSLLRAAPSYRAGAEPDGLNDGNGGSCELSSLAELESNSGAGETGSGVVSEANGAAAPVSNVAPADSADVLGVRLAFAGGLSEACEVVASMVEELLVLSGASAPGVDTATEGVGSDTVDSTGAGDCEEIAVASSKAVAVFVGEDAVVCTDSVENCNCVAGGIWGVSWFCVIGVVCADSEVGGELGSVPLTTSGMVMFDKSNSSSEATGSPAN